METDTKNDCGACSWPWQWSVLGKVYHPLLATINQCVPVKNTLGGSAIELCACEIIQIFSVVSCVVRVLHKFDYILVTKETPNKWWLTERRQNHSQQSLGSNKNNMSCLFKYKAVDKSLTVPTSCADKKTSKVLWHVSEKHPKGEQWQMTEALCTLQGRTDLENMKEMPPWTILIYYFDRVTMYCLLSGGVVPCLY